METMQTFTVLLIGLIAGVMGGLLGIGGAVVIIPALVMFTGISQHFAQGTTLVMLSLPVSATAAWQYYKAGCVDVRMAILLGVAFMVGGYFGGKLVSYIPQEILKKIFALLLLVIAGKMLFLEK